MGYFRNRLLTCPSDPRIDHRLHDLLRLEIGQFLVGTLERMKLGPFEIAEVEENGVLIYQLQGPAAQQLGQAARAAEAL